MAGPSTSAQRVWQSLNLLFRSNRCSVGVATLLTASSLIGLVLTSSSQHDRQLNGLLQLASSLQLVQAFRADSSQQPPLLWQRRLGVTPAQEIWQRLGHGLWWQGWSVDGQAYLVLPSSLITAEERKRSIAHDLSHFVVLSADALNRQHLRERLASKRSSPHELPPLLSSCLQRLARGPAVVWRPEMLARFSGASAPLLQAAGHGCLSLRVSKGHLQWQGWIGSRDFALAPRELRPGGRGFPEGNPKGPDSLQPPQALLMLEGEHLGVLFSALASRDIIRRPLEKNYGLGAAQRTKLLEAPFRLRLLPLPQGAFKAGLQLQLWPQAERISLDRSLQALRGRLIDQGLNPTGREAVIWRESGSSDQDVIGGWRWLQPQSTRPVISVGLGMSPAERPLPAWSDASKRPDVLVDLQARPADLASRGLLDGQWPRVVTQAQALSLRLHRLSSARESSPWSELSGQLALSDAGES